MDQTDVYLGLTTGSHAMKQADLLRLESLMDLSIGFLLRRTERIRLLQAADRYLQTTHLFLVTLQDTPFQQPLQYRRGITTAFQ